MQSVKQLSEVPSVSPGGGAVCGLFGEILFSGKSVLSYERDKGKFYLSLSCFFFFFFSSPLFLFLLKIGDKEF